MYKKEKLPIEKSKLNPLAWGTLFFTFWFTLRTTPKPTTGQNILAYSSIIISAILWLSIIVPWLRHQLSQNNINKIFVPLIFAISFMGYTLGWVSNLTDLKGIDFPISVYFGLLWVILYLLIIVRVSKKPIGILGGLFFAGSGVYYIVKSNLIGGITLIVIGILTVVIAARRPKWLWHESIEL